MNAIKERILEAVTVMNDSDAEKVWNFVVNHEFVSQDELLKELNLTL